MSILLIIGIIILVLWLLGFIFFKSIGAIIHVALVVGLILLIIWLLRAVFKLFQWFQKVNKIEFPGGLANVTTDSETTKAAKTDADYF